MKSDTPICDSEQKTAPKSSFMLVPEIEQDSTIAKKSIYNMHWSGQGDLAHILTKVGGKLGCWREDYEIWKASRRRLKSPTEQRSAA